MNDRRLVRQYGVIEPDERFRLAIRASARDDREEFERLVESCPEKVYRQSDVAFVERAEAARLMSLLVTGEICPAFVSPRGGPQNFQWRWFGGRSFSGRKQP